MTPQSKLEHYRQEARRLRREADTVRDGMIRFQLLELARQYEELADDVENRRGLRW